MGLISDVKIMFLFKIHGNKIIILVNYNYIEKIL